MPNFNVVTWLASNLSKTSVLCPDSFDKRWSIIVQGKQNPHSDENKDLNFDILEIPFFAIYVSTSYEEVDTDDAHVICYDHEEVIWKN